MSVKPRTADSYKATVENYLRPSFGAMKLEAVKLGHIRTNPADLCELPRAVRKEIHPLDNEAIAKFLKIANGNRYEAVYVFTLFTGLREGEVLGLLWDCVDIDRGTIIVNKQLQKERRGKGEYHLVPTKNGKSRQITVPQRSHWMFTVM